MLGVDGVSIWSISSSQHFVCNRIFLDLQAVNMLELLGYASPINWRGGREFAFSRHRVS